MSLCAFPAGSASRVSFTDLDFLAPLSRLVAADTRICPDQVHPGLH